MPGGATVELARVAVAGPTGAPIRLFHNVTSYNGSTMNFDPIGDGSTPSVTAKPKPENMKRTINWRQLTLYALFAGCFYALMMLCDETGSTAVEFIAMRIKALALMFVCGYPIYKLTKGGNAMARYPSLKTNL